MPFISDWRSSRLVHGVVVLIVVIQVASNVKCCPYWLIVLLQSVSLDQVHFDSSMHSAGRWMFKVAVKKA